MKENDTSRFLALSLGVRSNTVWGSQGGSKIVMRIKVNPRFSEFEKNVKHT